MGIGNMFGGAMIGGLAGGLMTGDTGGIIGGAAMGVGAGRVNKLGAGLGLGGLAARGMRSASRGLRAGRNRLISGAVSSAGGKMGVAFGYGADVAQLGMMGARGASRFIGRNAITANKYAGYGMAAMGVGAGAYIGSTVLNSNRGR